jgi:hypothetical protein
MKTLLLAALLGLAACSSAEEEPDGVLPRQQFVALLIDMELTEAYMSLKITREEAGRDDVYKAYKAVFEKHNVDEAQFEQTMEYYARDRASLQSVYAEVMDSVMARKQ